MGKFSCENCIFAVYDSCGEHVACSGDCKTGEENFLAAEAEAEFGPALDKEVAELDYEIPFSIPGFCF